MAKRIAAYMRNNVLGLIAIFIAIGAGAYAAGLPKNSVKSKQIKAGAVKTDELADNAVTSPKVADGSLLGKDFAAGQLLQGPPGPPGSPDTPQQVVEKLQQAAEPWHQIGPASSTSNLCADPNNTAVFCTEQLGMINSPWHNYGGGFASAAFYKDQLGIVHLRGLVASNRSATGQTPIERMLFRLPAAYRPNSRRAFASIGREAASEAEVAQARIDVYPDGVVTFITDCPVGGPPCSASGGYVTLDGITFRPDE